MLPVRNKLVNPEVQNVPDVGVKNDFDKAVEEGKEGTEIDKEVVKIKKKQVNNTEQFLEELHKLIESWGPQSTNWEGDKRIILYDWECREEIRKLMIKHGL